MGSIGDPEDEPSYLSSMLDMVGGVCIALAAAACSGMAHARSSPTAWPTLIVCAVIISPFAFFAGLVMLVGLLCCSPIVFIGVCCAWAPMLLQKAQALSQSAVRGATGIVEFAQENPIIVTGVGIAALPLLPLLVAGLAVVALGFVVFAPVTFPATAYCVWRWHTANKIGRASCRERV